MMHHQCRIAFQNENLIARLSQSGSTEDGKQGQSEERILAVVPDLICIIDAESGEPVTTELLRYGLRVTVLGIPAPPQLRTPRALEFVGPGAFEYDTAYQPLG